MAVDWHPFDYDDRASTAPDHTNLVWIVEEFTSNGAQVMLGYHDGQTFRTWWGSDDCSVTHWADVDYPAAPDGP